MKTRNNVPPHALFASLLCLFATTAPAQGFSPGHWSTAIESASASSPVAFHFSEQSGAWKATVSFARSGVLDMPVESIEIKGNNVTLDYPLGSLRHRLEASVKGNSLSGVLSIGDESYRAEFERIPIDRPYATEELSFRNEDVTLAATLFLPKGPGPHPAVVILHGSGDFNERWRPWPRFWADFYARQGVACLTFDKRGVGDSTGEWKGGGFEPLARDGIAAVELLKKRADIDTSRIGLTGISQAGWIMVLAASLCDDISYLIADSGPTYTVAAEGHFDYLVKLKDAGFSEDDIAKARDVLERNDAITRTGEGYTELREYIRLVRREPWYRKMGLFMNASTSPDRIRYRKVIDFDPAPLLQELDIPILWLYGEEDKSVDPIACKRILERIQSGKNKDYTMHTFPGANHGIHVRPDPKRDALPLRVYPNELLEAKANWLKTHVLRTP